MKIYEELVIDLTKEEKKTLYQFLFLYLGSAFALFAIIAYLFYQLESRFFYDSTKHHMQQKASMLSSNIIHAHMSNRPFSLETASKDSSFSISFYNKEKEPIIKNDSLTVDFSQKFYIHNQMATFIDQSTFGHLGVEYIVIEKYGIKQYIEALRLKILFILFGIYSILTLVGYFLAKLFIKPIQMKRVSLDNFIKDSTHELNTPITALMLSINSPLLQSPKNLERIKLSAKRISDIHKDLTYLLLKKNQQIENQEKLFLNSIVNEELHYLTLLAEKRKIVLNIKEDSKIYFNIDKESFIRLIHNLVSNAIKYNKVDGTILITFKDNSIFIEDTGIGIPKEHQSEIYERFYRATHQVGGFGLGLNIVYKICKDYNIKIEFRSKVNKGTIFILTFI